MGDDELTALLLASGLGLLVFGGEALVRGSAALALRSGLTPLFVGLTVVSFGTSAPELAVSLDASLSGEASVAVGTVIGSNIANLALILGVSALLRPVKVKSKLVKVDVPILIVCSFIVAGLLADGSLGRWEGLLLVIALVAYAVFGFRLARRETREIQREFEDSLPRQSRASVRQVILILGGIGALALGGHVFVDGALRLAHVVGVSSAVIALSVVAVGTSLPELATSVIASVKGHPDLAIGNAIGSNIFNLLGILGIAALVHPLGLGDVRLEDIGAMIGCAPLLLILLRTRFELHRWEGGLLFISYWGYVVWLFIRLPGA